MLKFSGAAVAIRDLETAVPEGPQIQHIDLKLQRGLGDADIDRAGQAGGELVISGVHGVQNAPVKPGGLPGLRLETDRFTLLETDRFLILR